jgi:hypothetical protein
VYYNYSYGTQQAFFNSPEVSSLKFLGSLDSQPFLEIAYDHLGYATVVQLPSASPLMSDTSKWVHILAIVTFAAIAGLLEQ